MFPVDRINKLLDFLHLRNVYLMLILVLNTRLGIQTSSLQGLCETPLNLFCGVAQSSIQHFLINIKIIIFRNKHKQW